jgi:hypothetical protein
MPPLRVLLTNNTLDARAGTELYIRDVALSLHGRGHHPVAFSTSLGGVADALRQAGVAVVDDLDRIPEPPDVIHGHHHLETLIAVLHFPGTPAINFCHGWLPWEELPLRHPAVRRYVAVDDTCRARLVDVEGIDPARVEVLLNFVDLARFRPRAPLPARPARALVYSNHASEDDYVRAIRAACLPLGMPVDVVGHDSGRVTTTPETLLGAYDLVFAKGRAALEALAVGCAVVLSDRVGRGPLVTESNVQALRRLNFGFRALDHPHDADGYAADLARYDAEDASRASAWVRQDAGQDEAIDRLLAIYADAIAQPPGPGDPSRAAAAHVQRIRRDLNAFSNLAARLRGIEADLAMAQADLGRARAVLAATEQSAASAVRRRLLRLPVVGPVLGRLARIVRGGRISGGRTPV